MADEANAETISNVAETSIVPLKFGVWYSKSNWGLGLETKHSNMAIRQPFWKWHGWKSIAFYRCTPIKCFWNSNLIFKIKLKLEYGNKKNAVRPPGSQTRAPKNNKTAMRPFCDWRCWKSISVQNWKKFHYGRQTTILKMLSLHINWFLPIYTNIALLYHGVDIQSRTTVWKPKNAIRPPSGQIRKHKN